MTTTVHHIRSEVWIARILQSGIILSAALMLAGLFLLAAQSGVIVLPAENPSLGNLFHSLFTTPDSSKTASTFMYAGIVVLIFTPFLRVAATLVVFLYERDWKYVAVAAFVLFMLIGEVVVAFR